MTPPDEGTIREAFGELRGEVRGLRDQIGRMESRNTREHEAVMEALDGVAKRVDSLEASRDRKVGRTALVNGMSLAIASLVGALGALFGSNT